MLPAGRTLEEKDWFFSKARGPLLSGSPLKAREEAGAGKDPRCTRKKMRPVPGHPGRRRPAPQASRGSGPSASAHPPRRTMPPSSRVRRCSWGSPGAERALRVQGQAEGREVGPAPRPLPSAHTHPWPAALRCSRPAGRRRRERCRVAAAGSGCRRRAAPSSGAAAPLGGQTHWGQQPTIPSGPRVMGSGAHGGRGWGALGGHGESRGTS